jgi:cob(I)alamin adenosyltransferase
MSEFKIYTKKGDRGETSLLGGTRVSKNHPRVEAYGTVDELNSHIGLLHGLIQDQHTRDILLTIQGKLFITESILAAENKETFKKLSNLVSEDITLLENEIDLMNDSLPELKNFILPCGHYVVSLCHIARCICRRAERVSIGLLMKYPFDDIVIQYLNRLSDYLFILARFAAKENNATEYTWIAK